jgi:hypothetical protein
MHLSNCVYVGPFAIPKEGLQSLGDYTSLIDISFKDPVAFNYALGPSPFPWLLCTPATGAPADTTPTAHTPTLVNHDPSDMACTPGPAVNPEPAPRPLGNFIPPPQPIHMTRNHIVTLPRRNGTPHAHTPAMDVPTTPRTRTPVSLTRSPTPITVPSRVPAECAPTAIVHGPRDLSTLRLDAPNPWGTLRRHHYHCYSHTCRQFRSAKRGQLAHLYPANAPSHKHPVLKSAPFSPFGVFEMVKHLHRIGPNKPVI